MGIVWEQDTEQCTPVVCQMPPGPKAQSYTCVQLVILDLPVSVVQKQDRDSAESSAPLQAVVVQLHLHAAPRLCLPQLRKQQPARDGEQQRAHRKLAQVRQTAQDLHGGNLSRWKGSTSCQRKQSASGLCSLRTCKHAPSGTNTDNSPHCHTEICRRGILSQGRVKS